MRGGPEMDHHMFVTRLAGAFAVVFALWACATLRPSVEQEAAHVAWDRCPKAANLALVSIERDGLVRYRAVSNRSGARELADCLTTINASVRSELVLTAAP